MEEIFCREEMLIGSEALKKLNESKVAIFGIGGVGSYVVEALARAGIGKFILVDNDIVSKSNINRQIIATAKTIGKLKVNVAKQRIQDINPKAEVKVYKEFFTNKSENFLNESISYIADCIDTVTGKIELCKRANKLNIPIISSMGTGNKLNPTLLEVSDIYKTEVCPLAKVMRKELKASGINKLKVVYSKEQPIKPQKEVSELHNRKQTPGSISFMPSVAGLIMASEIVKDIIS